MKENIQSLKELIDKITPIDKYAERKFHISQMRIAKPLKSLGALDKIAYQIAGVRGITQIDDFKKSIVIFAGDHGIASKHVSLFKSNVTSKVFKTIADGLAPINVIAKQVGADITLVDLGLKECIDSDNFLNWKVKEGTNDMTNTVAMSISETIEAILKGAKVLETEKNQNSNIIAVGEIGIGNTTAASAITSVVCNISPNDVVGKGTGISCEKVKYKTEIVKKSIDYHNLKVTDDPLRIISSIGGLEIAGVVGLILGAAARKIPIIIDGFITTAAASIAQLLCPDISNYLIASHVSSEPGHKCLLEKMGLSPLLDLQMRLGMASGAAIATSLVEIACKVSCQTGPYIDMNIEHIDRNLNWGSTEH